MTSETKNALMAIRENIYKAFGDNLLTKDQLMYQVLCGNPSVSYSTFKKYVHYEIVTQHFYYNIREIVDKLNACSGTNCDMDEWEYKVDDNGKVYEDIDMYKVTDWGV